jgi:ABC-type antimicrobial peptide transport system permease subunit
MRQGVGLVVAGVSFGLIGALIASRAMSGLLVAVSPTDPLTFCIATAVLTIAALVGCYLPARRAIRVDPILALRY